MELISEPILIDEDDAVKIDWSRAVRNPYAARFRENGYSTHVRHRDGSVTVTRYSPQEVKASQDRAGGRAFFERQLRDFSLSSSASGRDDDFDEIIYRPLRNPGEPFLACPASIFISRGERVSLPKHSQAQRNVLLVFIWHAGWKATGETLAVPQLALEKALQDFGLLRDHAREGWTSKAPEGPLREFMAGHRIGSGEQMVAQMEAALGRS